MMDLSTEFGVPLTMLERRLKNAGIKKMPVLKLARDDFQLFEARVRLLTHPAVEHRVAANSGQHVTIFGFRFEPDGGETELGL